MGKQKYVAKEQTKAEPLPELSGMVTVIGVSGHLKADKEYKVTAKLATTLIKKGSAKLKS